jgi:hypothetical protein
MKKDEKNLIGFLRDELLPQLGIGKHCDHTGESGEYCGKCGADLRVVTSYECRVCSLLGRTKVYPAEKTPNFCTQCGSPKFLFAKIRKKIIKTK